MEKNTKPLVFKDRLRPTSLKLADWEEYLIKKAMKEFAGERELAAEAVGISLRTLNTRLSDYGIKVYNKALPVAEEVLLRNKLQKSNGTKANTNMVSKPERSKESHKKERTKKSKKVPQGSKGK